MLIALLLPAVQAAREAARRMQCGNNVKQLGLAVQNFHDTYNRLPCFNNDPVFAEKGKGRLSFLYALLPFIEQAPLYDNVISHAEAWSYDMSANTDATRAYIGAFICPSDGNSNRWSTGQVSKTSYRGSLGDVIVLSGNAYKASSPRSWLREGSKQQNGTANTKYHAGEIGLESITDGTSNTLLITEGVIYDGTTAGANQKVDFRAVMVDEAFSYNQPPSNCLAKKGAGRKTIAATAKGGADTGPGDRAYDTHFCFNTGIFTVLPPNSPSCTNVYQSITYGGVSASSEHPGGVQTVFADGAVKFVTDTVHTKNLKVKAQNSTSTDWFGDTAEKQAEYWVPLIPKAANADGTDAVVGEPFSYGVWAQLGAINDGAAVSL